MISTCGINTETFRQYKLLPSILLPALWANVFRRSSRDRSVTISPCNPQHNIIAISHDEASAQGLLLSGPRPISGPLFKHLSSGLAPSALRPSRPQEANVLPVTPSWLICHNPGLLHNSTLFSRLWNCLSEADELHCSLQGFELMVYRHLTSSPIPTISTS